MSIFHSIQVEVFFDHDEFHCAYWQPVSRWDLEKDYGFFRAWSAVSMCGWPKDDCHIALLG